MSEEENMSVEEEAVAQPAESETEGPAQTDEQHEVQDQPEARMSDQEYNWREARREREEQRRANDELRRMNEELLRRVESITKPQAQPDELAALRGDDITTVDQVVKIARKQGREEAEKIYREQAAASAGERLETRYPDFNDVVTSEAVETLQKRQPELFASLQRLADDPYAQGVGAYKLIRELGIGAAPDVAKNRLKALENSRKPVSVQSTKKSSAVADVHNYDRLTPELQKELYKQMTEAAKAY